MRVSVNGEVLHTAARTLAELLQQLQYGGEGVATAVDGVFVAIERRSLWQLDEGQRIDIVAPIQGG